MSEILVNYNRLNINDIIYKKPEKFNKSYYAFANYKDEKNIIQQIKIQTAYFKVCKDLKYNKNKCILDVQFINDVNSSNFYKLINELDEFNITTAVKNSENWGFNDTLDQLNADELYKTSLKFSKNSDDKPCLRLNVDLKDDLPYIGVFDKIGQKKTIDDIKINQKIKCIIEYIGLQFGTDTFTSVFKLKQLKIYDEEICDTENLSLFIDTDDEDDESTYYVVDHNCHKSNNQEPNNQEPNNQEPNNQESNNQESNNQESNNQEVNNQELNNQEPNNQEPNNQEPNNQEPNNQESNNQKPNNQEPNNQESDNQEPNNQESNNKEPNNQESNNKEQNNQEHNNTNSNDYNSSNKIEHNDNDNHSINQSQFTDD